MDIQMEFHILELNGKVSWYGGIMGDEKEKRMNVCMNMIMKNEEARIERCLRSAAPHVQSFVLCDTGSTDKTREVAAKVLSEYPVRCHIVSTEFKTWDQARNDALVMARKLEPESDYLLLFDADMELVVPAGFNFNSLDLDGYQVRQDSGSISYYNLRMVRTRVEASYKGVTHEYLAVKGTLGTLTEIHFRDYADGSNRKDKCERDIKFLKDGILGLGDGLVVRYMFYLAQSLKDIGQTEEAMSWYIKRSESGGWHEEAWFSRYMAGLCAKQVNKIPEYIYWELMAAATIPDRAEPWVELSTFFREKGWPELGFLFSRRASECKADGCGLFVDRASHSYLPLVEMSISGYYLNSPEAKELARKAAFFLLVAPEVPEGTLQRIKENAVYYLRGASDVFQDSQAGMVEFGVREGVYGENNPSIVKHPSGGYEINVRSVNYKWEPEGPFRCTILDNSDKVNTKNFYLRLDDSLNAVSRAPVSFDSLPPPPYDSKITGIEDLRMFRWKGRLFAIGMSTQYNKLTMPRQVLIEMSDDGNPKRVTPLEYSAPEVCEKNWMPISGTDDMMVIYKCHPFTVLKIDPDTGSVSKVKETATSLNFGDWKGSSQAIPYNDGWVFVIHEIVGFENKPRVYWHRLVFVDRSMTIKKFTEPFCFTKVGVEYCAGIAEYRDGVVISFGVEDRKAGLCWIPKGSLEKKWIPVEGR